MMNCSIQRFWRLPLLTLGAIALAGFGANPAHADPGNGLPVNPASITVELANNNSISALAAHLKKTGAKMYGAYWCPYCTRQMEMFGAAFRSIDYVECDPRGKNPRPELCKAAKIQGYPTWEINGKFYPGVQSFEELAEASNYKGSRKF
ncbi:MAG: hypothetical protein IGS48_09300 [Oscillatoriales cyanobacterium C42_A2020_001]|nr:hypothetical protein [Leptolyngbyaceae cyanobacterium C42_A2020_001]